MVIYPVYTGMIIGSYYLIEHIYLDETGKKHVPWYAKIAIGIGAIFTFATIFLLCAFYTLKSAENE
jgi:hypothetical protein